jgi:hypothetical protein
VFRYGHALTTTSGDDMTTTDRPAQTSGQIDARARDLYVTPHVSYGTARIIARLEHDESTALRIRLRRSLVRLLDAEETCTDEEFSGVSDTYADQWELLREIETCETVRTALLVASILCPTS